ncbi:MAG: V-type ATP synthase subunit B [Candidatus Edwardsbacteria bacterium RIFOXYD12_FULL_50_11]|uniref:V-type ATP synthase beta chain n=1 Tax=Candidatus Edwardsbacteria bacterium GWF2_54_11 TaxID=1817851 RepID=A0A1F5RHR9_9BACT|nr:MAG: V-type ATP synthase subunit B [Candidatus Edwardsbacteria bacterium RifOxyC12_full_54_24]OGF06905.1 MAG: V-type ATP synthase subunit B [Candidatus Edwardsbacteria bacterium RifOxyA12_full_54_48]OGF10855.1 MAG: V-type ATP synthase subunit B [Candidatus Edwardsbacteria bacterium GWE2_54_12]OGF13969.1 MAG: V-type ATP synthase subunit B [Candidatus Edwardsbacteria bacterium GWF2_54_11]OGF14716.1 MAG: V-type ATP synthase subunit B [Candidatus Edwardsbacteria bacterium RIFOXYD12_FULL_50_11]O
MIQEYNLISRIQGDIITVQAAGIRNGELATVKGQGRSSLAQVIRLQGDQVFLQVFAGTRGISTGDQVRFLKHPMQVAFGEALLGRIFNGSGQPMDGGPELKALPKIEIGGPSVNPIRRVIPRGFIETRVPMVDVFNPLVESQKLPIFAAAGEPYNELLARIGMRANADVVILGGIGLKYDEYLKFKNSFEQAGVLSRTIMFIHTASDPVVERLLVPDLALAAAEQFGVQGKRVLVLLSDMTAFADALKEIAISMDQVPSNLGYPGSLYSDLAARYEKAVDFEGAGSITILAVTTMPGDDVTHPVPDNTGYITEGQFYLRKGVVEPFGSLSRLKQLVIGKVTREDHGHIMNSMIRLYAKSREVEQKLAMGFDKTPEDDRYLDYSQKFYRRFLDLKVDIGLEQALDLGWQTLAECFTPDEVGIKQEMIDKYWPKKN